MFARFGGEVECGGGTNGRGPGGAVATRPNAGDALRAETGG